MIVLNGLNATNVMVTVGLFYILAGLYFQVPVPVQPMKVIGAYAIAMSLTPRKNLDLNVLKQSAGFTLDGATSSKKLLILQRNNFTNNHWFTSEYFTGITAKGKIDESWRR